MVNMSAEYDIVGNTMNHDKSKYKVTSSYSVMCTAEGENDD